MSKLYEQDIVNSFIGKKVNEERLNYIFRENGSKDEYIAYPSDWYDEKDKCEQFKITPRLMRYWSYSGIYLMISVDIKDGIIVPGTYNTMLTKGRYSYSHGRPGNNSLKETQQEIRILRRVLEYITAE